MPANAVTPAQLASARSFVNEIYRLETSPNPDLMKVRFIPRLRQLIARDRAACGTKVCAIDADPFCDCQEGIHMSQFSMRAFTVLGTRDASATIAIRRGSQVAIITIILTLINGHWSVEDITGEHYDSFFQHMAEYYMPRAR